MRYQGVQASDAYDNKGNLKAGLTQLEDGRIMTFSDAEDANLKIGYDSSGGMGEDTKRKMISQINFLLYF